METEIYKAALEQAFTDITAELSTIATLDEHTGDWVAVPDADEIGNADENVEADAVETWNERRALMAQLEIRYRNIARALEKISRGTFGTCEICNEQIEVDRLQANQAARTCLAHMEREKELTF